MCDALLPKVVAATDGGRLDVPLPQFLAQLPAHTKLLAQFDQDLARVSVPPRAADKAAALAGLERLMLGSVSERVVREAKCPVMVVRTKGYPDVELLKVVADDHEHKPYKPPLRFSYVDRSSITRPDAWPIS